MPRNNDLKKILLIGSGPIVIGQGCEFDYSGVQACKALREEGYQVVLVNSNPATIMTDPEFADDGRTDRAQRGDGTLSKRGAGSSQSEIDWRQRQGDRERRRSPIVQGSDVADRARRPAV